MTDEPTIYEFAGGREAWLRLADEQYHRCLKDPPLGEQSVEEHAGRPHRDRAEVGLGPQRPAARGERTLTRRASSAGS